MKIEISQVKAKELSEGQGFVSNGFPCGAMVVGRSLILTDILRLSDSKYKDWVTIFNPYTGNVAFIDPNSCVTPRPIQLQSN